MFVLWKEGGKSYKLQIVEEKSGRGYRCFHSSSLCSFWNGINFETEIDR